MTSLRTPSLRTLSILALTALALAACQASDQSPPSGPALAGPIPQGADVNTPDKSAKTGGIDYFGTQYRSIP